MLSKYLLIRFQPKTSTVEVNLPKLPKRTPQRRVLGWLQSSDSPISCFFSSPESSGTRSLLEKSLVPSSIYSANNMLSALSLVLYLTIYNICIVFYTEEVFRTNSALKSEICVGWQTLLIALFWCSFFIV